MKKALIFHGGWEGHEPDAVSQFFADALRKRGAAVTRCGSLDCLDDAEALLDFDLIMPCWTMGDLSEARFKNLDAAVSSGIGLGGFHGGMGDAFRGNLWYQWLVGGQFVEHPEPRDYSVRLTPVAHPVTEGMPQRFDYHSEIYYMLVDPANIVLAETDYHSNGRDFAVPVVWVKPWGKGKVFYSALGHQLQEFIDYPVVTEMTLRGLQWAASQKPLFPGSS